MILEDDACFGPNFTAAWSQYVVPLLAVPHAWDCLVLGYFREEGPDAVIPVDVGGRTITYRSVAHFFGSHAYVLTRRGAEVLRGNVYPMDHQSDGILLTMHEIGLLRLLLLPVSIVTQCMDAVEKAGAWHTHTVSGSIDSLQSPLTWALLLLCGLLAGALVAAVVWRRSP